MDDPRYHTKRWRTLRAQAIRRDGRRCSYPDCTQDMTLKGQVQVDHIREVSDGGDFWNPNNLQILCKTHHTGKTTIAKAERTTPTSPNA